MSTSYLSIVLLTCLIGNLITACLALVFVGLRYEGQPKPLERAGYFLVMALVGLPFLLFFLVWVCVLSLTKGKKDEGIPLVLRVICSTCLHPKHGSR